jgi:hypothetical protein
MYAIWCAATQLTHTCKHDDPERAPPKDCVKYPTPDLKNPIAFPERIVSLGYLMLGCDRV